MYINAVFEKGIYLRLIIQRSFHSSDGYSLYALRCACTLCTLSYMCASVRECVWVVIHAQHNIARSHRARIL